jgi:integrase
MRYDNFRNRVWVPAVTHAELDGLTFHQLRHTAAAFMMDERADPLQVTRRMGHEDVRTTFNLYGHRFPNRRMNSWPRWIVASVKPSNVMLTKC